MIYAGTASKKDTGAEIASRFELSDPRVAKALSPQPSAHSHTTLDKTSCPQHTAHNGNL